MYLWLNLCLSRTIVVVLLTWLCLLTLIASVVLLLITVVGCLLYLWFSILIDVVKTIVDVET